jgi:hypothetical protein
VEWRNGYLPTTFMVHADDTNTNTDTNTDTDTNIF